MSLLSEAVPQLRVLRTEVVSLGKKVSRTARVGLDKLAWLASACLIDIDELMMA